ncbi:SDR family oxidoreductase [Vibrio parahaemolyticus]|uniref:SDR family oxidoreductase n=1 Tax=Vibrio parahaemolyticus TaxID=670 RepID=UPI0004145A52|nr:SDR family oxidoreductase [Vibrio parahaemolyticus]HCH6233232.1 SDR family oxidoreductase [Vibrio parahaemolyticus]HCM1462356.1 SDR family oxidoreductase [Vibrio parahaemolyticus]
MTNVVIFGATSAIAEEIAKCYASKGSNLLLFARDEDKLQLIANDLNVRGASSVEIRYFSALDYASHNEQVEGAFTTFKRVDVCVIAYGSLPDQAVCEQNVAITIKEVEVNSVSVVSLLSILANKFEQQRGGSLVAISSVAGDRGRQSNYVYGAAKAMVSTFLQGLSQRLSKKGVHVLDIKPGFVDTPMTESFAKGPLWTKPSKVAKIVVKRVNKRSQLQYVPSFWALIMFVIKMIPQVIFNKIKL